MDFVSSAVAWINVKCLLESFNGPEKIENVGKEW